MASSVGHQSPQSNLPPLQYKTVNTQQWLTTGNTDVVSDGYVDSNSVILIMPTSSYAGRWYVSNITPTSTSNGVTTNGSFTVTSTSSETATTTTYSYIIL